MTQKDLNNYIERNYYIDDEYMIMIRNDQDREDMEGEIQQQEELDNN